MAAQFRRAGKVACLKTGGAVLGQYLKDHAAALSSTAMLVSACGTNAVYATSRAKNQAAGIVAISPASTVFAPPESVEHAFLPPVF